MPKDFRVSITNAPGKGVYPISSFTWILLYENPKDKAQAKMMVDFMKWALTDGQKFAADLGYAPLPAEVVKLEMAALGHHQGCPEHAAASLQRTRPRRSACHHRRRSPLIVVAARGGDRLRARGRQSRLSIAEVRPELLDQQRLGSGRGRVRRAPVHLGHAVFVDPRARCSRRRSRSGIAIYLSELCPPTGCGSRSSSSPSCSRRFRRSSTACGASSCWCRRCARVQRALPDALRQLPFFSGPPVGVGMLAAVLILAIMIIPFTSSVAREVLKAVPVAQREAAYALGATRWEAIRAALFYARTGIVGAIMLGFGRALGETMAVTMVIGNNPQISLSLFAPQYTMAARARQRVHRGGRRALPPRADRGRPGAVRHHADRQLASRAADLADEPAGEDAARRRRSSPTPAGETRMTRDTVRRLKSRIVVWLLPARRCCSRWCRWR